MYGILIGSLVILNEFILLEYSYPQIYLRYFNYIQDSKIFKNIFSLEDSHKKAKQLPWYLVLDKSSWKSCCWEYIQDQFIKKTIFIVIENIKKDSQGMFGKYSKLANWWVGGQELACAGPKSPVAIWGHAPLNSMGDEGGTSSVARLSCMWTLRG